MRVCEYDRSMNLRRWVRNGLKACNVVVNELSESAKEEYDEWVGGWVSNVARIKELVGVCNGRRRGIAETTRTQVVDLESDLLTT
jgi:hypothetical protein